MVHKMLNVKPWAVEVQLLLGRKEEGLWAKKNKSDIVTWNR